MKRARLNLDISRSGISNAGVVWAGFFIDIDGEAFPDRMWTDFAVVVLEWWSTALTSLATQGRVSLVRFMEGPFLVEIDAARPREGWLLTCIEDSTPQKIRARSLVDAGQLVASCMKCGEVALELCTANNWMSEDTQRLDGSLRRLRSEFLEPGNES